jgi:tripeptide aminopeptidase
LAEQAMRNAGVDPKLTSVRGGTDGSRLTERGLPTPNIFCGEHNAHSLDEWCCLEEMEQSVNTVIELVKLWARERD